MGAALATLAATHSLWDACLQERPASDAFWQERRQTLSRPECMLRGVEVSALYTFGSPRVGDLSFNLFSEYDDGTSPGPSVSVHRFVNANDIVARVPDTGYVHACRSRSETDGLIYLPRLADVDVGGKSREFLSDPSRAEILEYVGDHGIDLYAKKLVKYAGKVALPPRLTEARARNERIKAAFLDPRGPALRPSDPSKFAGGLADQYVRPVVNNGSRKTFLLTVEGTSYAVFEDTWDSNVVDEDNQPTGMMLTSRRYLFLDAAGIELIAGSGEVLENGEVEYFLWTDYEDLRSGHQR